MEATLQGRLHLFFSIESLKQVMSCIYMKETQPADIGEISSVMSCNRSGHDRPSDRGSEL
ncbi:MAG: hypothetical protein AVDCRST_MAG93-6308 [uncultured Chloroflexia bacterium]|uniref:Uncharacterized protein n=1 Tax=uncultured Chloroflexia bacterium TaxID=1672391 RepID=A0A6J4LJ05_9CHLR|nr:MAG: hypothetical protein AVDCRST_MAG93-6308 [uncultured Chloroflexia bacterium]